MKKVLITTKRIFIICLPIIGFILANLSLKSHHSFCLIKLIFGHECWGCGLTRAFAALSRLDFKGAYEFNHLIIIVAPLMFILWILILKKEFFQKDNSNITEDVKG